jgi:hypothetical protein
MLSVTVKSFMLSVVILSVVMLSIVMLSRHLERILVYGFPTNLSA